MNDRIRKMRDFLDSLPIGSRDWWEQLASIQYAIHKEKNPPAPVVDAGWADRVIGPQDRLNPRSYDDFDEDF